MTKPDAHKKHTPGRQNSTPAPYIRKGNIPARRAATEVTTSARDKRNFSGNLLDGLNDRANHNELLLAALVRIAEALEKQNEILTKQTQALEGIANRIEDLGRCL